MNFRKFLKLELLRWVHSRTLQTRKRKLCKSNDTSKLTFLLLTILNQCEIRQFETLVTLMKVQISDFRVFLKLEFQRWVHRRTLESRKGQLCSIKDISKLTCLLLTIPNLCERRHFDTLQILMKVQIQILGSFQNMNFSHGSTIEHLKQKRHNFVQSRISLN